MTECKTTPIRIDQLLVEQGHAQSRARAQALIKGGHVLLDGKPVKKPSLKLEPASEITITGSDHPWVGRAGIKLDHAIRHFNLDPSGAVAMDIGSSTGGFTQVLLHYGAAHVFAVDVGRDQLASSLRSDERVSIREGVNARELTCDQIDRKCNWVVCDASFISLSKVLEKPLELADDRCHLVALIKPQFEVGKSLVGKGGIVRDKALHEAACAQFSAWLNDRNWQIEGVIESPIKGSGGNIEFLISAFREADPN